MTPPQWNIPMECPSPYLLIVKEPQKNANNNGRNFSGIFVLTVDLICLLMNLNYVFLHNISYSFFANLFLREGTTQLTRFLTRNTRASPLPASVQVG